MNIRLRRPVRFTTCGCRAGLIGHVDTHGALVHDEDQHDLRRIADRGEALQHLDVLELLRRAQARGHVGDRRRAERIAGFTPAMAEHLVVGHDQIAVDRGSRQ